MMSEKLCLKWNDFHSNVSNSFSKLRKENDFNDVTLVSDDQKQISAHKVVLSSSSEYFKCILKQNKHQNPLLCLEGVSSSELNNILDYIYYGEVNVYQEDLDRFLNIAERYKLEGLMSNKEELMTYEANDSNNFDKKEVILEDISESEQVEVLNYTEQKTVISQNNTKIVIHSEEFSNIEELDAKILEHIEKNGSQRKCTICNKILRDNSHAKEHVETHFDGLTFYCQDCGAGLSSRSSLRCHVRKHR